MSTSNMIASQPRLLLPLEPTPTPGPFNDRTSLNPKRESDIPPAVLELVRADNPELKICTEMQIRLESGVKLDVGETKLGRYERTIEELRTKQAGRHGRSLKAREVTTCGCVDSKRHGTASGKLPH